ncbi:FAD-dependent oxidoreductase [Nocardia sp. R6R-6]|uniref:FAD-dependent oxidoreductase n=1 Tax=Nocardia sp. R6R-6 TaxID=3459303 RepID=UPI00403D9326
MVEPNRQVDGCDYDVVVVGAGMGGIYGAHRFASQGLRLLGLEAAAGFGGVWYHNRYPGARVDVESQVYNFLFDRELVKSWEWSERYASQPEILAYLEHVAGHLGVRDLFRFESRVTGARWDDERHRYTVDINGSTALTTRFLVMATGQLSKPHDPPFTGLADFRGRWVRTGDWPRDPVDIDGKRVAVIGTGSSGVQVITEIAPKVASLHVFQRTPAYTVPSRNRASGPDQAAEVYENFDRFRDQLFGQAAGIRARPPAGPAAQYSPAEQRQLIQQRWDEGGATINFTFSDQSVDLESSTVVGDFVRDKISEIVADPATAAALKPTTYPIGTRRVCVSSGYYETYNRDNVVLVDIAREPIVGITRSGIKTAAAEYEFDLIVFALGFDAFTGALEVANIVNHEGRGPTDHWVNGPATYLGLMTTGFPNLFTITGPGSPSVLANMFLANTQHLDLVGDLLAHMTERGLTRVEPSEAAQTQWTRHANEVAEPLLRRQVASYMVQVGQDGQRYLIPYAGGFHTFVEHCSAVVAGGFTGMEFR